MAVILPSVYKDGTATVAAGGTAVTGQGTLFTNAVLPGDFFGVHKGYAVRIASVESNTALTLANPWPGTAQTAAAYEIMLQGDMARVQESTRQLLVMLTGGNISAFADLAGAADTLPYFTGSGSMALAALKPSGRNVLDSENMTVLLSRLGPTFGGSCPNPANAGVGMVDGNFDTVTYPGVYSISGNWSNGPSVYGAGAIPYPTTILEVERRNGNDGYFQILRVNQSAWKRTSAVANATSWNGWFKIEHQMLGLVSQLSGTPIGSIFENGSNANGSFVKFGDGTQICYHGMDLSPVNVTTQRGAIFGAAGSTLWTFPAAFAGSFHPRCSYEFARNDLFYVGGGCTISKDFNNLNFVVWNSSSNPAGNSKTIFLTAIGRWF